MNAIALSLRSLRATLPALLAALLGTASLQATDANPPARMTYQGYLTDANGLPLAPSAPKNYNVIFRIFSTQTGGSSLWAEQQTLTVNNGYFSVLLGEGSDVGSGGSQEPRPSLPTLFYATDASDRYVEVTVIGIGAGGADVTILPRLRLMASPYSFLAQHATTASSLVDATNSSVISVSNGTISMGNPLTLTGKLTISGAGADIAGDLKVGGNITAPTGSITVRDNITTTAGAFVGAGTIPIGGIIMWAGSTIPSGWALCDGNNGTPNLTDKFVLGAGRSYSIGAVGTNTTGNVTLSVNHLPPHTHTVFNVYQYWTTGAWGLNQGQLLVPNSDQQSGSTGSGQSFSIMPPYYALAFIMRKN